MNDAASAALALSFKLQRVANVPEHPHPSTRLMSCAHIANRQLSRIIGATRAFEIVPADGSVLGDAGIRLSQQDSDLTPRLPPRGKPRAVSCTEHCRIK